VKYTGLGSGEAPLARRVILDFRMDTASARIMNKLLQGTLPAAEPLKLCSSFGTGLLCDGCDMAIKSSEQEHEVEMPNGRTLRFHVPCHGLWRALKETRPGP
jgi:hypothetical protein